MGVVEWAMAVVDPKHSPLFSMPHCNGHCFIHVSLRVVFTGSSSARIVVTLVHALRQRGLKRGIASACIGGGEAMAVAVEVC
jgi:hypothetical protein